MRRFAFLSFGALVVGCAKSEQGAATDTVSAAGATMTAPAPLSLADVAGKWNMRGMPETSDSTIAAFELNATGDTAGWTMTFPNRKPIPVRVVAVAGDSVVTEAGPYESVLRKGVQVTTRSVTRLQGGKLIGATVARYKTSRPDSVLRVRTEGTRIP